MSTNLFTSICPRVLVACSLTAAFGSGCMDSTLEPLQLAKIAAQGYVRVEAHFCTEPRESAKQKIKYLFIVDHSGSNQDSFAGAGAAPLDPEDVSATDSNGGHRYGIIRDIITPFMSGVSDLDTSFALVDFNDFPYQPGLTGAAIPKKAPDPSNLQNFVLFTNASDFWNNYVTPDWRGRGAANSPSPYDQGFTNYASALNWAYNLIILDATRESAQQFNTVVATAYDIIFISDGLPVIASGTGTAEQGIPADPTDLSLIDLTPTIQNIVGLLHGKSYSKFISSIALNTVYYTVQPTWDSGHTTVTNLTGPQLSRQAKARTLLQKMASMGNGSFQEIGGGLQTNYLVFAPPIRNLKYQLTDAFVENVNATWWDDGRLLQDTDGDGIPDLIETQIGSSPFLADTDGNGVSDLVEYRTTGFPCQDSKCAPAGRNQYGFCAGFSPVQSADGTITYPSTAKDGLNDCEKFVIGANRSLFDSNGDFVPDLLAFKNLLALIPGANTTFLNPFGNSLDNYSKLKAGYPISVSQGTVIGYKSRATTLLHQNTGDPDVECYDFAVDPVVITGADNKIKISVIENTAALDDKPILKTAVRALSGKSSPVIFDQADFQ